MIQSKNPEKKVQFQKLVDKFKQYEFKNEKNGKEAELINPYHIEETDFSFNSLCNEGEIEVLNPWNWWYGNLDAEILLIGQDWGAIDSPNGLKKLFKDHKPSKTDKNLMEFLGFLGYTIDEPFFQLNNKKTCHKLFFTNAILGIRKGNQDTGSINIKAYKATSALLSELIQIIDPKYIIALGAVAYNAIYEIYREKGIDVSSIKSLSTVKNMVEHNGKYPSVNGAKFFVVYHPATREVNRSHSQQLHDWKNIKYLM
jgi:DNA polymerase